MKIKHFTNISHVSLEKVIPNNVHPITKEIIQRTVKADPQIDVFVHHPVRTSEEAAHVRTGYSLEQGAKALIVRIKESNSKKYFVMLVVPGNAQFSIPKVKSFFDAKDVRFATEGEVSHITQGVLPGGIPPLGCLFNLPTYVDASVLAHKRIIFNAGDKRVSVGIPIDIYMHICDLTITQLC